MNQNDQHSRVEKIKKLLIAIQDQSPNAENVYIEHRLAKKLYSMVMIQTDIIFLETSTKELVTMVHESVTNDPKFGIDALWYGIIAMYGRIFRSNHNNARLEGNIFDGSDQMLKLHEKLLFLRDNFIAHRPESDYEVAVVVISSDYFNSPNHAHRMLIDSSRVGPPKEELADYLELFSFLKNVVNTKIEDRFKKLAEHLMTLSREDIEPLIIANMIRDDFEVVRANETNRTKYKK